MSRLRHGYTNRTRRVGPDVIEKRYEGPDARDRLEREHACLTRLSGRLPLPEVLRLDLSGPTLLLREAHGAHGQDLIEAGHAREVLRRLGSLHLRLRAIEPSAVPGLGGVGDGIVHGDFGPQNLLIDQETSTLLDWEFAHLGDPVEDLAWAEWIVRIHHPGHSDAIPELFRAAQLEVAWGRRHRAMVARCADLLQGIEQSGPPEAIDLWRQRLRLTESWTE